MRSTAQLSVGILALAAASACGDARATSASQDELARDLELAASTAVTLAAPKVDPALLNSMETAPKGAPEAAKVVKKGPGPRAVRSRTPTVRATPEVEVAANESVEEVVETESIAPVPEPTDEPVAVAPRPTPVIVQTGGAGDYGTGGSGDYGTGGGVFGGGIGGIIIRGGGIDGDNCVPRGRRGGTARGPIYVPTPTVPSTGGIFIGGRDRATSGGIGSRIPGPSRPSSGVSRTSLPSRSSLGSRGPFSPRGR